jgi:bacterioferritin (cytochrome b1)
MRVDPEVLQHLNAVLKNELTAINQYFPACAHAAALGHWEAREDTNTTSQLTR